MGRTQEKFRCMEDLALNLQTTSTENTKVYVCLVRPGGFFRQFYLDSNFMGNKYKEEYKPGTNEYSWSYIYCRHTSAKGEPLSFDFSVSFGGPSVICLLILFHQHN